MRDEYQEHWLREHRWKVVGTTAAIFGLITMALVRWAKDREREESLETLSRFEDELRAMPPPAPVMPEEPPAPPPPPPLRFLVTAGSQAFELGDRGGGVDVDGALVTVRERAEAHFAGGGFGFDHPSAVSVSRRPDGGAVAVVDGASVTLVPIRGEEPVAPGFPGAGAAIGGPQPISRRIAGGEVAGQRHRRGSGAVIDVFTAELGKRKLAVILYRDGDARDVAALDRVLDTLAADGGKPGPQFELAMADARTAAVAIGAPTSFGTRRKTRVVVKSRPTIRRTIGALTFEHPWSLAVSPVASDAVTSVAVLRGREVAMRIVALPMAMGVGAARSSLLGSAEVRDDGPVEASFGGDEVRGKRFVVTSDIGDVRAELFVLERGRKHIGAALIYVEAQQGEAYEQADAVLGSVH